MNTWAKRLHLWNWVASAALLFASIAPALSQVVVPDVASGESVMVCTSTGMKVLASPDAPTENSGNMAPMACGFCVLHALAVSQLANPAIPPLSTPGFSPPHHPPLGQHLQSVLWSPGLARAPPSRI
jgi:hypothetical protein